MPQNPAGILKKIAERKQTNSFRTLTEFSSAQIDFSSNDYLGFAKSEKIFQETSNLLQRYKNTQNGATGSRLISGTSALTFQTEEKIATFHKAETALLFNSGYDANIGLLSSVPQRNDLVFFDEFSHASIRDGIKMSFAKSLKFNHNDLNDLAEKIEKHQPHFQQIFIVTESVFSMDGDQPDLKKLISISEKNNCFLILDEAHALGVIGKNGEGLAQNQHLEHKIFARIVTFGKAMGVHGAAILGNSTLKEFLVNFARSFIYTTALPPHSLASILVAYQALETSSAKNKLVENIQFFKKLVNDFQLNNYFISSDSAIQSCIILGNERVKELSSTFLTQNFQVKAILSPTVPKGKERLRFCIHTYNSKEEIKVALTLLKEQL
ncbi:aminotransferase class I/II-fold pyridoxal phosphate-dependent enzyme [Mesonia maritima]|uniref:8-amino-7-oxononanoate synthase n=1 Tax=Mesonia maritima TaxID=1793873 RepID=A0ABU1K1T8_9FLAO|nr:pyridoxal phosphate-dependent aminotransferase family protein [Mesonia maritima]MDR6299566.1 8-amino-7-oxononanoate synthase [Mesonia maritima]